MPRGSNIEVIYFNKNINEKGWREENGPTMVFIDLENVDDR